MLGVYTSFSQLAENFGVLPYNVKSMECSSYLVGVKKAVLVSVLGCLASTGPRWELLRYFLGYILSRKTFNFP